MIETHCAVCNKDTPYTVLYEENFDTEALSKDIFSARRSPDQVHYRIVKCDVCGLIFSNPILELDKIENLYKESEVNYEEQIPYLKKTYGQYLEKALVLVPGREKLLEIGCGNGFFLETAKKLGFIEVYGVEPGKESVAKARVDLKKNIHIGFLKANTYQPDSFDVVCLFQTFDHLPNPNQVLQICHTILKPGGLVLAINHNVSHIFAKVLGRRSPIIDIAHTYLYNPKTFREIFTNNNYQVIDVFDIKNTYPLSYWLHLLPWPQKQKIVSLLPEKLKNKSLKFNAGNMGIIAQKYVA